MCSRRDPRGMRWCSASQASALVNRLLLAARLLSWFWGSWVVEIVCTSVLVYNRWLTQESFGSLELLARQHIFPDYPENPIPLS